MLLWASKKTVEQPRRAKVEQAADDLVLGLRWGDQPRSLVIDLPTDDVPPTVGSGIRPRRPVEHAFVVCVQFYACAKTQKNIRGFTLSFFEVTTDATDSIIRRNT